MMKNWIGDENISMREEIKEYFNLEEGSCEVLFMEGNAGYMPSIIHEDVKVTIPLLLTRREVELTLFKLLKIKHTEDFTLNFFRNVVAGAASMSMKYKS
jgi:hypothetical protein